jgi:hypothetical protein
LPWTRLSGFPSDPGKRDRIFELGGLAFRARGFYGPFVYAINSRRGGFETLLCSGILAISRVPFLSD